MLNCFTTIDLVLQYFLDKCKLEGVKLTDDPIAFRRGLFTHGGQFYLDGQPFRILGGSFHYFRTLPEQWMDRW